ncbi:MAG: hypothetical protein AABY07_06170 [Nanoarchaeota archaeon]
MQIEDNVEVYLKNKILDLEENAYKSGFVDGRKTASRIILDAISPIITDDCLKRITKMIRKIDLKENSEEELLEEVT